MRWMWVFFVQSDLFPRIGFYFILISRGLSTINECCELWQNYELIIIVDSIRCVLDAQNSIRCFSVAQLSMKYQSDISWYLHSMSVF